MLEHIAMSGFYILLALTSWTLITLLIATALAMAIGVKLTKPKK